ncbi:hypothetical protein VNO78_28926 [Psophocarpus tetragonolobus]|uniref:Uncharacterized protein n=1 Tax=Psophocarpus tetragonolobus TaxID=3891 RepID=A0AAN9RU18_PSOTE
MKKGSSRVLRRLIDVQKAKSRESKDDPLELRFPVTKDVRVAEVARQLCVNIALDNLHLPSSLSTSGEYEVTLRLPRSIPLPEGKLELERSPIESWRSLYFMPRSSKDGDDPLKVIQDMLGALKMQLTAQEEQQVQMQEQQVLIQLANDSRQDNLSATISSLYSQGKINISEGNNVDMALHEEIHQLTNKLQRLHESSKVKKDLGAMKSKNFDKQLFVLQSHLEKIEGSSDEIYLREFQEMGKAIWLLQHEIHKSQVLQDHFWLKPK